MFISYNANSSLMRSFIDATHLEQIGELLNMY